MEFEYEYECFDSKLCHKEFKILNEGAVLAAEQMNFNVRTLEIKNYERC